MQQAEFEDLASVFKVHGNDERFGALRRRCGLAERDDPKMGELASMLQLEADALTNHAAVPSAEHLRALQQHVTAEHRRGLTSWIFAVRAFVAPNLLRLSHSCRLRCAMEFSIIADCEKVSTGKRQRMDSLCAA
jgi:hypothetical protein